jgi:hypothetical protein
VVWSPKLANPAFTRLGLVVIANVPGDAIDDWFCVYPLKSPGGGGGVGVFEVNVEFGKPEFTAILVSIVRTLNIYFWPLVVTVAVADRYCGGAIDPPLDKPVVGIQVESKKTVPTGIPEINGTGSTTAEFLQA